MKINKIKIASFGKFKDKEINFTDGFNLVYGENEMGKTTVMEFIKMMFYGSKKGSDALNPRKKYLPWNSDKMAGSIEFEQDGTFYRLDREFRSGNSTDKITLWNLDMGESENISGGTDIGARFFGMSAGAFEKSLFIANDPSFSSDVSADGEINAKLSSLTASFDDDTSAEQVSARISDAAAELSTKTGRGGSIVKLETERDALITAQKENEQLCNEREDLEKEIDSVKVQLAEIENKRKEYFEKLKNADRAELREKLLRFTEAASNYEQTESKLKNASGEMISPEILETASKKLELLKRYENENINSQEEIMTLTDEMAKLSSFDNSGETQRLEKEKEELAGSFEGIQEKIKETEIELMSVLRDKGNIKSKPNVLLLIIGGILAAIGVALCVIIKPYFAGLCAVGAALAAIGIVKKKKPDTAALDSKISALEKQKEELEEQKNSVSGKLQAAAEQLSMATAKSSANEQIVEAKREENIRRREKQLEDVAKTDSLRRELFELLVPFGCKASTSGVEQFLKDTAKAFSDLEIYRIKAENAAAGTKCTNLAEAKAMLGAIGEVSSDENAAQLKEKMAELSEEKAKLENRLTALTVKAKTAFKGLKTPIEYEREISEIDEKISSQKQYYETLKIAQEALIKASAGLRRNFSGALENRALEIFSGITGGRYTFVSVSKNFDINLQNNSDFGAHAVSNLSKGTADQAYFALRLALSEMMGKQSGGLPIFLDDVFSQYDDKREQEGYKYLQNYAKNAQIIFFTCHNSGKQTAEQTGANVVEM